VTGPAKASNRTSKNRHKHDFVPKPSLVRYVAVNEAVTRSRV